MRKWLAALLTALMVFSVVSLPAVAEEAGKGQVVFTLEEAEGVIGELSEEPIAPVVPETMDKVILGSDNRITVSNPSQYPYSAICYMEMTYECGCQGSGSGFLVGEDTVFTAAHCVVCTDHGKWAEGITFYFGFKNHRNYLYRYNSKWYAYAGNTFPNKEYSIYGDYAVVKLYENVSNRTGSFGAWWNMSDSQLSSTQIYAAGYRDGVLRYDQGYVSGSGTDHIQHWMDTVAGNSGCPLFTDDYYAVGIHIGGTDIYNNAFRLNTSVWEAYNDLK